MKKLLILFFLCLWSTLMVAQNINYTTKESRREFYQNILQKYGTSTLQFLFDSQPDYLFEYYIDGNSESHLIDNLCTVLHEYAHHYNEENEHGISHFVDENGSILFPYTETFYSDQLNNMIRKGLQDSIYRYHLYVGSKNKLASGHTLDKNINTKDHNQMSSIVSGIYGMFEEFSAYYIGTLTDYSLLGYYIDTYGNENKEAMHEYIGELTGNTIAFYEFSLFMGWYLQYARSNYPDVYSQIMDNQNFRVAFTLKYNQFQTLVSLAENRLDSLHSIYGSNYKNELDYSGSDEDFLKFLTLNIFPNAEVEVPEMDIYNMKELSINHLGISEKKYKQIKNQFLKSSRDIRTKLKSEIMLYYLNPYKILKVNKSILDESMKQELNLLMIDGVTQDNYISYLK